VKYKHNLIRRRGRSAGVDFTEDRCVFLEHRACRIDITINCGYGITEVTVPPECPLRKGSVTVSLERVDEAEFRGVAHPESSSLDKIDRILAEDTTDCLAGRGEEILEGLKQ
jgi:hypothetical protein